MIFIGTFILSWILWFIFADKNRWRELFPTCFFAANLGCITDNIMHHSKLWKYKSKIIGQLSIDLLDDFGIYFVVTYLFIQYLPRNKNIKSMTKYWVVWTSFAIVVEWIHIKTGYMEHHSWWTLGHSYISDWILFFIFYKFYYIFGHKKPRETRILERYKEGCQDLDTIPVGLFRFYKNKILYVNGEAARMVQVKDRKK